MARSPVSLARIVARLRWTPDDARVVLAALDASGLAVGAFAARHHVQAQRLFAWRRTLAARDGVSPSAPLTFVEVASHATVGASTPSRYEIVLATGDVLRIEGAVDADAIRTLLDVLRAGRAC